jgi:hypothetical protein
MFAAALSGNAVPMPVVSTLLAILLVGLWRLTEWARKVLTGAVVLLAIIVPVGIINPFAAMDMAEPPPVGQLAIWLYIPCAVGLVYVYLLGRYRSEFRRQMW